MLYPVLKSSIEPHSVFVSISRMPLVGGLVVETLPFKLSVMGSNYTKLNAMNGVMVGLPIMRTSKSISNFLMISFYIVQTAKQGL